MPDPNAISVSGTSSVVENLPLIISILSFFISCLALYVSFRKLSVSKKEHLDQLVNQINDRFVDYEVIGPVTKAISKEIEIKDPLAFQKKAVCLLNQLNYFQTAFEAKAIIGKKHFGQINEWFTDVVVDWVKADPDLIAVWKNLSKKNDFQNPKFAKFVKEKLKKV